MTITIENTNGTGAGAGVRFATSFRYTSRADKARYIAEKYAPILGSSVLDVGCDKAPLRALVTPPARYVGVDISAEAADVVVDLDREALPFGDRSFETVLCTDVLEHLERCHAVFDELCRVAATWVVVSLPNPLRNMLLEIAAGSQGRLRHYGLPATPPVDRHRWFFGSDEAEAFVRARASAQGFVVEQMDFEDGGCPAWVGSSGVNRLTGTSFTRGTMWCVLRRGSGPI